MHNQHKYDFLLALNLGEEYVFDNTADAKLSPSARRGYRDATLALAAMRRHHPELGFLVSIRDSFKANGIPSDEAVLTLVKNGDSYYEPMRPTFDENERKRLVRAPVVKKTSKPKPVNQQALAALVVAHTKGAAIQHLVGEQWLDDPAPTWLSSVDHYRVKPVDLFDQWLHNEYSKPAALSPSYIAQLRKAFEAGQRNG